MFDVVLQLQFGYEASIKDTVRNVRMLSGQAQTHGDLVILFCKQNGIIGIFEQATIYMLIPRMLSVTGMCLS